MRNRHRLPLSRPFKRRGAPLALGLILGLYSGVGAFANPQGANVVHGQASFARPNASTLNTRVSPHLPPRRCISSNRA